MYISALSAPCSRQTTTPAPHHSFFTDRMPFLPPNQQRQSAEGKYLITPTLLTTGNRYRPLKKIAISNLPMQTNGNLNLNVENYKFILRIQIYIFYRV